MCRSRPSAARCRFCSDLVLPYLLRLCVCKMAARVRVPAASCRRGSTVSFYCPAPASRFWRDPFSCVTSPRSCSCSLKVEAARSRVALDPRPGGFAFLSRRVFALSPSKKNSRSRLCGAPGFFLGVSRASLCVSLLFFALFALEFLRDTSCRPCVRGLWRAEL